MARAAAPLEAVARRAPPRVAALAAALAAEAHARRERRRERRAGAREDAAGGGGGGGKDAADDDGGATALDALALSHVQLGSMLGVGWDEAREVLADIARACVPTVKTAAALRAANAATLATPLEAVELAPGHLVEIVGRAGTGKTQFCLTTAVDVAARAGRAVVYLDTENKFSAQRVAEVIRARSGDGEGADVARLADLITVFSPRSARQLERDLDSVESLVAEQDVALVLVDSVAALAGRARAAQDLLRLAARLKLLGETCQVAVLVTNQVTAGRLNEVDPALGVRGLRSADAFGVAHDEDVYLDPGGRDEDAASLTAQQSGHQVHVLAALGNTWAHAVNVRIVFELEGSGRRRASLVKAPHRADTVEHFVISDRGVEALGRHAGAS